MWIKKSGEQQNEATPPNEQQNADVPQEMVIALAEEFIEVLRRFKSAIGKSQMTEASRADDLAFIDNWLDGFGNDVTEAREAVK